MTTPYTPGRLQAIHGSYLTIVGTNESIGRCGTFGPHMENARRLAACWNACTGVPTEQLIGDHAQGYEPWGHVKHLQAELDALRHACRELLDTELGQIACEGSYAPVEHDLGVITRLINHTTAG